MRQKLFTFLYIFCFLFAFSNISAQTKRASVNQAVRTITVITEPTATVWIDGVRRGETDESGKLVVKPIMAGTRKLTVRAEGFGEISQNLTPAQKGNVKITLVKTNDAAELAFQQAEKMLSEDKNKSVELYKKAIALRPKYEDAYIGLARTLSDLSKNDEALKTITQARKIRPVFPEASAVEGRIYKNTSYFDKAIDSFDRAVKEGKGFQPEAHTGLALLFMDEAESAKNDGDLEDETYYYGEAAKSFEKAIEQLSATEPVVYLFLGKIYEDTHKKQKAVAVYERFLRDMPEDENIPAVKSFIIQLKKTPLIQ